MTSRRAEDAARIIARLERRVDALERLKSRIGHGHGDADQENVTADTASALNTFEQWGTELVTFADPGRTVKILAWASGYGNVSGSGAADVNVLARVEISVNGGSTFTAGRQVAAQVGDELGESLAALSPHHFRSVTPTGEIQVRLMLQQQGATAGDASFANGSLLALVVPA